MEKEEKIKLITINNSEFLKDFELTKNLQEMLLLQKEFYNLLQKIGQLGKELNKDEKLISGAVVGGIYSPLLKTEGGTVFQIGKEYNIKVILNWLNEKENNFSDILKKLTQ